MALILGVKVVAVALTPRVVERPTLVGDFVEPPPGELLAASSYLYVLPTDLGGL